MRRPWCILLILEDAALPPIDGTKAYARLRRDVINAGILDHNPRYYTVLTAILVIGIAVSLAQVIRLPVSVSLVCWSLVFSFFCVQLCGIVHDAGHRAIFRSIICNTIIGEVCCAFLAMGFNQWRVQHNIHHAHTNDEGEDPDLKLPLHAFTQRQFHAQRGVWHYLRRFQVFSFYPLRTLVVFSRRLSSIQYFRTRPLDTKLIGGVVVWAAGMLLWFGAPFLIFPLTKAVLLFAVIHISMGLYLSNIFAPNHKGMSQIRNGTKISFLEQQIRTSRNITPNWAIDVLYMGLSYQIEHHLFPTCPRHKLKRITPYVVAMCQELNLEYTQVGVFESHRIIVAELNRIAQSAG